MNDGLSEDEREWREEEKFAFYDWYTFLLNYKRLSLRKMKMDTGDWCEDIIGNNILLVRYI